MPEQLRIIPRQAGDTTPLAPGVTETLRRAGLDPAKFRIAPGAPMASALSGLPPAGASIEHSFLFSDRSDALRCVESFADRGGPVTITRAADAWSVAINAAPQGVSDASDEHRLIAAEVIALGGVDRGFTRATVTTRVRAK